MQSLISKNNIEKKNNANLFLFSNVSSYVFPDGTYMSEVHVLVMYIK